jgi:N-acyl-phosphatidylethanolamine-hydrolysing phospholipase D
MKRSRSILAGAISLVLLASSGVDATAEESARLGPAPKSADGRFTNPSGGLVHGDLAVRFPFFLRRIAGIFRERLGAPTRIENDGVFLRENAGHSIPTVTWIGHSTFLVQMDHVTFLTDPIWSDTASPLSFAGPRRFVSPGVAIEDLPPIDFVLVSHNHYDHLDVPTLVALAERDAATRFFVPSGNAELLRKNGVLRVVELDWGETARDEGVTIHCLPAQHWSKRGLNDDLATLWASWAVTGPERRFYFAGDTGYFNGFSRIGEWLGPFDLAAVPIGAYEPATMMQPSHLNPEEAFRAVVDLRGRRALAMHFGTFDLSDEPLDEPPRRFLAAAARDAAPTDPADAEASPTREAWVLQIGETRPF